MYNICPNIYPNLSQFVPICPNYNSYKSYTINVLKYVHKNNGDNYKNINI